MKRSWIAAGALLSLALSSCLKDKGFTDQEYGLDGIEDIQLVEFSGAPEKSFALNYVDIDTSFALVTVHLNSAEPADKDIQVTLTANNDLVSAYNAANGTNFEVAPSSIYTLQDLTVTIPKGSRDGELMINTNPADLSAGEYALGFSISSISDSRYTVSGNYSDIFVYVGVKNKYDGIYEMKGYHNRVPYTFPYDETMYMITRTPNSVTFFWPEVNSNGHPIGVGPGSASWYGAAISPVVVFDPATDEVTDVYNIGGATPITLYTGPGAADSRFDPATRTIYVSWNYNNNPDRAFFDTLYYQGPRP